MNSEGKLDQLSKADAFPNSSTLLKYPTICKLIAQPSVTRSDDFLDKALLEQRILRTMRIRRMDNDVSSGLMNILSKAAKIHMKGVIQKLSAISGQRPGCITLDDVISYMEHENVINTKRLYEIYLK